MSWKANWIWIDEEKQPINTHVGFRKVFKTEGGVQQATLRISADTLFRVWVNGVEVGDGPIRSSADHWYYEQYEIGHLLKPSGDNIIAVSVWHYGHSNYQYIENQAGFIAQLNLKDHKGQETTILTDDSWKAHINEAFEKHVVKRNVNIGWLEMYDARRWDDNWLQADYDDSAWTAPHVICPYGQGAWGELYPKEIEPFAKRTIMPTQLTSLSEVRPIQKIVSVNMRENFFPERRDANVMTFSGYFACAIEAEEDMSGKLTFAHTPWNGVRGRFKIDSQWHEPGDEITLTRGKHLFLVEIAAVHNDVLSHMEWDFPAKLNICHPWKEQLGEDESAFVTFGPYQVIIPVANGKAKIYGGVEKKNAIDKELPEFKEIGTANSLEELKAYEDQAQALSSKYVMENYSLYSLSVRKTVVNSYSIKREYERMLYDHDLPTVGPMPKQEGDIEYVMDFGKLYVGRIELDIDAPEGTVIDVYGFEAYINGKIRYTSGLNNGFRYITKGGRQKFKSNTRMGFQHLIVTVRNPSAPVSIYKVAAEHSTYPVTDQALFRCSDPLLNDIWEISRQTSEVCTEDTFVDCPTYERVFWVGDCRVSALVNYHIFGSYELVKHCLELVPRSREQSPLLLSCLPTDWQTVIPMWTFSWMIACKDYYEYTGDSAFIEKIYPEYAKTLDTYCEFLNDKDLFDISSWNLVDWADMEVPYTGVGTAQHGALAYCCKIASEMATHLGRTEDVTKWNRINERMKIAVNKHMWMEEKQAFIDGQHRTGEFSKTYSHQTHALLYLFEMLDGERKAFVEERLLNPPEEWVQIISPFMSFYLFEVWHQLGRLDSILERIRDVWGTMVRRGSTTCWETYPNTRSFAHAWSAAPAYVMGKHLLGVKRTDLGFASISIDVPDTELTWVEGSLPTPYGRVDVSWSKENGERKLLIKAPAGIQINEAKAASEGWEIEIQRFQ